MIKCIYLCTAEDTCVISSKSKTSNKRPQSLPNTHDSNGIVSALARWYPNVSLQNCYPFFRFLNLLCNFLGAVFRPGPISSPKSIVRSLYACLYLRMNIIYLKFVKNFMNWHTVVFAYLLWALKTYPGTPWLVSFMVSNITLGVAMTVNFTRFHVR